MNRRELIKAAGAVIISGKTALLGFDLQSSRGHTVFFDPKMMGSDFAERAKDYGFPPNTVFYAVEVPKGKTLDDAIRIFAGN